MSAKFEITPQNFQELLLMTAGVLFGMTNSPNSVDIRLQLQQRLVSFFIFAS